MCYYAGVIRGGTGVVAVAHGSSTAGGGGCDDSKSAGGAGGGGGGAESNVQPARPGTDVATGGVAMSGGGEAASVADTLALNARGLSLDRMAPTYTVDYTEGTLHPCPIHAQSMPNPCADMGDLCAALLSP